MQYRTLGRTGLRISEIGFGCGTGAGLMIDDVPEAQKHAVARALELGITYFDTAPIYGDKRSELHLGRTLKALGAKPVVATKIALELEDLDDIHGAVVASVEGSLERLQLDAVDVVYLHNRVGKQRAAKPDIGVGALLTPDDILGKGGVVSGLQALRKRGLVKHFGCCSFGGEMDEVAKVVDSDQFEAMLVHYSMLNQTAFVPAVANSTIHNYAGIAARAVARGMGIANLRILEAGLLANNSREKPGAARDENEARTRTLDFLRNGDTSLAPAAIRFGLANPGVSVVLVGISEVGHVETAAAAEALGPLPAESLTRIEAIRAKDFA